MSETQSNTEEMITDQDPGTRSLKISIDEEGKIALSLDGEFKVHEVFGILHATMKDLEVQNFTSPHILNANRALDQNNDKRHKDLLSAINSKPVDVVEEGSLAKQITDLVNSHKSTNYG